ncbi:MAG: histidine kinase [bacterium]|nr:histidine kinase [bacterium]
MVNFKKLDWITRYKLHHLPFWGVYHYFWWSLYMDSALLAFNTMLDPPNTMKYLFYVVFQATSVYFCLYYLIPQFLEKGKYLKFVGFLALNLAVTSLLILSGYYISGWVFDIDFQEYFKMDPDSPWHILKYNSFPSSLASMTLGMSIKLAKNWVQSKKRQQELEKEKLETELKFLKSQFNPHFLFNTINSIFVLINKNTDMATDSLAKFSSLLRYQLYECNEPQIPLNREIAYLESFIELEKLRLNENFEVKQTLLKNYNGNLNIAPFVLMPFIENAFKHVGQKPDQVNWIKIDLRVDSDILTCKVSNNYSSYQQKSREAIPTEGGLGLKNVRRRLQLLYPDMHELIISKEDGVFLVELQLQLQAQNKNQIILVDSQ